MRCTQERRIGPISMGIVQLPLDLQRTVNDQRILNTTSSCNNRDCTMFAMFGSRNTAEADAIRKTRAVIEFDKDGFVLQANDRFLAAMGYAQHEIVGKAHKIFVDRAYAESEDYRTFWNELRAGKAIEDDVRRIAKNGASVWLQAVYTPISDRSGNVTKIIKFATDITETKNIAADVQGQMKAIDKSHAVIEFDLQGNILKANKNFLNFTGYDIAEIKGRHHSIFVSQEERTSERYARFWPDLASGACNDGQYRRVNKQGQEVWIQATYNVILDPLGKPFKVVKYATDITAAKRAENQLRLAVTETQAVVQAAMAKDLTLRVPVSDKTGEIADLCAGVNSLLGTLSEIVTNVDGISNQIAKGVMRIGGDAKDLADRTRHQASCLEETAATTEELTASVKESFERAQQATMMGNEAKQAAERGGAVMHNVARAMERIQGSSSDITFIVNVIDDIAFQTNLLALNAAVEAARAGDSGKGFAVVASEVRTLAKRAADAAKDITRLIANSADQVSAGVVMTQEASTALAEIMEASTTVASALSDISTASREQALSIEEVAKVVTHLDSMTQSNASMAQESILVADELDRANAVMQDLIKGFQLHAGPRNMAAMMSIAPPQRLERRRVAS
jgi:methyl-accepting chemotaxis protein